jgi:tRNA pseudouridine32 synthase / 23S rRNA pseudouridine746 synthase
MSIESTPLNQVQIIYLDDDILVVNKPAGLLTISDGYDPAQPYLKKYLEGKFGPIWVVHRLDKLTSGLIVFARNAEAHRYLSLQFENRSVEKKYHCYVVGKPAWTTYLNDYPLKVNADKKHRTLVDLEKGKPSKTAFSVIQTYTYLSCLEAIPHSGYTHQIRSHLYSLGFPIVGDELYGFKETRYQNLLPENLRDGFQGFLMLCAKQITLNLPLDHQPKTFSINLPHYFLDFHNALI